MQKNRKNMVTGLALAGLLMVPTTGWASVTVYGSLSNFDVYNRTGSSADGFEIRCDGVSVSDVYYLYNPWGYKTSTTAYASGVDVIYDGLHSNSPISVSDSGLKHFGVHFKGVTQPTNVTYSWLVNNGSGTLVGAPFIAPAPVQLPTPIWVPDVNALHGAIKNTGGAPIWVKKIITPNQATVTLDQLLTDNPLFQNAEPAQAFLLAAGDTLQEPEDLLSGGAVGGRAEFWVYSYTGPLQPGDPGNAANGTTDADFDTTGYHGDQLGIVMAAANTTAVPEPATFSLLAGGATMLVLRRRARA